MSRMIDLIRGSKVPPSLMRAAAKGALSLPAEETLEILVYLTTQSLFRDDARLTLAGWDENACMAVVSDPKTPPEILNYFLAPDNLRPKLVPGLVANPAVSEEAVQSLVATASQEVARSLLGIPRVCISPAILKGLAANLRLEDAELREVQKLLSGLGVPAADAASEAQAGAEIPHVDGDTSGYEKEHAAEIAAEEGKPFQLVGGVSGVEEKVEAVAVVTEAASPGATGAAAAVAKATEPVKRLTTIQKIASMSVGLRVQLALKGNKDERFILVRDGARVVCCAVLEAPKLSDSEAERFAGMKNVSEHVLRGLTTKRKFMKNYNIIRNLSFNPRCPMDVTLHLLKHLMLGDLKHLSMNKDVADTVRKTAMKMWKQKSDTRGGHSTD